MVHRDVVGLLRLLHNVLAQPVRVLLGVRRDHDEIGPEVPYRVLYRVQAPVVTDHPMRVEPFLAQDLQRAVESVLGRREGRLGRPERAVAIPRI